MNRVAAVVLNWNQSRLSLDCLAALRKSGRPVDHLVVVDNGSRRDENAVLRGGLPVGCRLVELAENRGFAGGMNAGIAAADRLRADYVWLVNNDAFPDPDCLAALVAALDADPGLACVTPRVVGDDGIDQPAGGRYDAASAGNEFLDTAALAEPAGPGGYWAVATVPLFRADALRKAGGFDNRFFAYWEEVDLCLRLGAMGYRFRSVPGVKSLHLGRMSTEGSGSQLGMYLYVRNRMLLVRKHAPRRARAALTMKLARTFLDNAGCYAAHGQTAKARGVVQAVAAGLLRETGRPRLYGRATRLADWVARHPWKLVRMLDAVRRPLPAGGAA